MSTVVDQRTDPEIEDADAPVLERQRRARATAQQSWGEFGRDLLLRVLLIVAGVAVLWLLTSLLR